MCGYITDTLNIYLELSRQKSHCYLGNDRFLPILLNKVSWFDVCACLYHSRIVLAKVELL